MDPMAKARLVELKAFLKFLNDACGFNFHIHNFNDRIALQKYVFIAKQLGWDSNYSYSIYVRGPYSSDLANDYYALQKIEIGDIDYKSALSSFDRERFFQIVAGKGVAWLEVAATILSIYISNKTKMKTEEARLFALERTKELKRGYSPLFIDGVGSALQKTELINGTN
ncbi:MAG: hypothetical protein PHY05_12570 [Methanothrix sp.]|nr:hypothetical protein [Methanothrix sp.]